MNGRLKTAYINKMVPHLLPIRAKSIGITPSNKAEWKNLAKSIKEELSERFDISSQEVIFKDMSFNERPLPVVAATINYELNDKIVSEIPYISRSKKEWISETRLNLLDIAIVEESKLSSELLSRGIKVYQKMPFVINGSIYFANLYLPNHNTIIEISSAKHKEKPLYGKLKQRLNDLNRTGNKVITINASQINGKDSIDKIISDIFPK